MPDALVQELLRNESLYKELSKKEGEKWEKIQSDEKILEMRRKGDEAARQLSPESNRLAGLETVLKEYNLYSGDILSLACGEGRNERTLYTDFGFKGSAVGVDLAESSISTARKKARELGLPIAYIKADMKDFRSERKFDMIMAVSCLHHVVHLEDVRDNIHSMLKDDGILFISDFIGESRFQWIEKRLDIVNGLFSALPESMRIHSMNNKPLNRFKRNDPDNLCSPFEAIRSAEIMPVFLEKFKIDKRTETNGVMFFLFAKYLRHNYTVNEYTMAIYNIFKQIDNLLISERVMPPLVGEYVLRKK